MRRKPELTVSVVVPVRDGGRYLGEALESVLAQTLPPLEVIVVDDGSTDGTRAVAACFSERGVQCVSQPPSGIGAARNRGLELARSDAIALLDADDLWSPDKLERQVAALEAEDELDLVFAHMDQFVTPDLDPAEAARLYCPPGAQPAHLASAVVARRRAFERAGMFPTDRYVSEFMDWLLRARDVGLRETTLPEILVHRRIHASNNGRRHREQFGEFAVTLKAALDRRRRHSP